MKRICIGKIVSAHGVKGLVKILPLCDDLDLLSGKVFTSEVGNDACEITLKNKSGKYILAEIAEITTREDAENSRCSLYVSRETLPDIDKNDGFYIEDLVGLSVKDQQNQEIGCVIAVQNFGAGDLIEIKPKSGQTYFLPFRDENIGQIDLEAGYIEVMDYEDFIL